MEVEVVWMLVGMVFLILILIFFFFFFFSTFLFSKTSRNKCFLLHAIHTTPRDCSRPTQPHR